VRFFDVKSIGDLKLYMLGDTAEAFSDKSIDASFLVR